MKPERASHVLLGVTRSKAKMYEYNVPSEHHIETNSDPSKLLILSIATLGEAVSYTHLTLPTIYSV